MSLAPTPAVQGPVSTADTSAAQDDIEVQIDDRPLVRAARAVPCWACCAHAGLLVFLWGPGGGRVPPAPIFILEYYPIFILEYPIFILEYILEAILFILEYYPIFILE